MTGLRSRLEAVQGVESIELDLGADGLSGITVRLMEGADEVAVLEGIRRLLVAYGTKTPREVVSSGPPVIADEPEPEVFDDEPAESEHQVIDLDAVQAGLADQEPEAGPTDAWTVTESGETIGLSVTQVGGGSAAMVDLSWAGRSARRQVPASARAIVQAVIDIAAELAGRPPISVIGMNLSAIEGTRLLTVIVGNYGSSPRVCTATVVDDNWPQALVSILQQVIVEPAMQDGQ